MPSLQEEQMLRPDQYPTLFMKLLTSILEIFRGEQICLQDSGKGIILKLIKQVITYMYNHEPFYSNLWTQKMKPLKWWMQIASDSNANLISRIAIKFHNPEHLIDSAKLYDYYSNGFEDGKYTHQACVHIPAMPMAQASAPTVQSAPTILDLLNTENVDPKDVDIEAIEKQLFNHPDPYDLTEADHADEVLDADKTKGIDDWDTDDDEGWPRVVCSLTRFDIAEYIKLDNGKLNALVLNLF
ncbi:hypothetical protein CPB84DRAFT_1843388 [Gymnopilus junonius]|uniref:Uncharacterized protein n=1 Tax=Gymnopilus junonius TaxID=109634 RepID=A0A9P5NYT4_GYMJU|nr:hypothetical protein CPB84DRAFT_1843388 [Gymnopilus junonius]